MEEYEEFFKEKNMYKPLSDSTLMNMTKKEIIEHLRIAEHNHKVAEETINQQAQNMAKHFIYKPILESRIEEEFCKDIHKEGYNKAVEDMEKIVKGMRETATAMMWPDCEYACERFLVQIEKLKAGDNND